MIGNSNVIVAGVFPWCQAGAPPSQPSFLLTMLPLLLIVVVMYFLMIRPQQKRQKAHQAMLAAIKTGDEVVTAGGLYGTVAGVDERANFVYLKIAQEVKVKVDRSSIARVVTQG